jgi:hypothetical protein
MKAPVGLGWVSSRPTNPFVVIADANGNAVAQAIGRSPEIAMENARFIVYAVNKQAGGQ